MPENYNEELKLGSEKNVGNIISTLQGKSEKDEIKRSEVVVHTMPKRFINSIPKTDKKARGIGFFILLMGAIILVVSVGLAYWYFFANDKVLDQQVNEQEQVLDEGANKEADNQQKNLNKNEAKNSIDEIKDSKTKIVAKATSTSVKKEAVIASSTKKIIANEATSTPQVPEIIAAADRDNDGLSDIEEALLGCNSNLNDSDGDGYKDLAELYNLYNPAGEGGIILNNNIEQYFNPTYSYSLYYPKIWLVDNTIGDESVLFKIGGEQFIQIIIQANSGQQSLEEWYKEQFDVPFIKSSQQIYKKGWLGIMNEASPVMYLANPQSDYIFTISLNLDPNFNVNYQNLLDMMLNSLEVRN